MSPSGVQLEGQLLYERQQALRAQRRFPPAPGIVATYLRADREVADVDSFIVHLYVFYKEYLIAVLHAL